MNVNTSINPPRIVAGIVISACLIVTAFSQSSHRRNGKIAFTSDRDGNPEIYSINPDGTNEVRLTTNTLIDDHPTWSPDGRKIAFLGQKPSGQFAIFVMNPNGTGKTEITQVSYQVPNSLGWDYWSMSWSPNSDYIAFQNLRSTYIVRADGTRRRFLTTGIQPAWSPDGKSIVFSHEPTFFFWQLYKIYLEDGWYEALPTAEDYVDRAPTWSPDGSKIAFQGWNWANFEDIVIANADGTDRQTFAGGCGAPCGGVNSPDWSPDGHAIVYWHDGYGDQIAPEIYVLKLNGTLPLRITNSDGRNVNPSWQPLAVNTTGDDE